jgi:hypothetical protein
MPYASLNPSRGDIFRCQEFKSRTGGQNLLFSHAMLRLRHIRGRRLGTLFALCVAYALALQTLMVSVGLGMSALAATGQNGFVICASAVGHETAPTGNPQKRPQCPFCFVSAQNTGHAALPSGVPATPAYVGAPVATVEDHVAAQLFKPQVRRCAGGPRAPPISFV